MLNSIDKDEEAVTEKTFSWAQGTLSSIGLGWDTLLDATAEQYEVSSSSIHLIDGVGFALVELGVVSSGQVDKPEQCHSH